MNLYVSPSSELDLIPMSSHYSILDNRRRTEMNHHFRSKCDWRCPWHLCKLNDIDLQHTLNFNSMNYPTFSPTGYGAYWVRQFSFGFCSIQVFAALIRFRWPSYICYSLDIMWKNSFSYPLKDFPTCVSYFPLICFHLLSSITTSAWQFTCCLSFCFRD